MCPSNEYWEWFHSDKKNIKYIIYKQLMATTDFVYGWYCKKLHEDVCHGHLAASDDGSGKRSLQMLFLSWDILCRILLQNWSLGTSINPCKCLSIYTDDTDRFSTWCQWIQVTVVFLDFLLTLLCSFFMVVDGVLTPLGLLVDLHLTLP